MRAASWGAKALPLVLLVAGLAAFGSQSAAATLGDTTLHGWYGVAKTSIIHDQPGFSTFKYETEYSITDEPPEWVTAGATSWFQRATFSASYHYHWEEVGYCRPNEPPSLRVHDEVGAGTGPATVLIAQDSSSPFGYNITSQEDPNNAPFTVNITDNCFGSSSIQEPHAGFAASVDQAASAQVTALSGATPTVTDGTNTTWSLARLPDQDNDGIPDSNDNCRTIVNQNQADLNRNDIGNACDIELAAVPDVAWTHPGTPVTMQVLANDVTPPRDPATVLDVTAPSNGTATNNVTSVTYTPDLGFVGDDTFTYTIGTPFGETSLAIDTVHVGNRDPIAIADTTVATTTDPVTVAALANDFDPDEDPIHVTGVTNGAYGAVTQSGDSIVYTAASVAPGGLDTFTYTISDPYGGTGIAVVQVVLDVADSDFDGVYDVVEDFQETDKFNPDTDGDFLTDGNESERGTDPLDRDSDDGSVNDERELTGRHSDPLTRADDVPLIPSDWRKLVDEAADDYTVAKGEGDITKSYYRQVLYFLCSAAGVSKAHPAGAVAMKYCPDMAEAVGSAYGKWAGDFPYEVFAGFLPTVHPDDIRKVNERVKNFAQIVCGFAVSVKGPQQGYACYHQLDEIGFAIAGTMHAVHELSPNFVKHARRIVESANGGTRLQVDILTGNINVMRAQHHLLFAQAVKPAFHVNTEVNGVFKWIAKKLVPFAASCEREVAIRQAMRDTLGKNRGNSIFAATDPNHEGSIASGARCVLWTKVTHLL